MLEERADVGNKMWEFTKLFCSPKTKRFTF